MDRTLSTIPNQSIQYIHIQYTLLYRDGCVLSIIDVWGYHDRDIGGSRICKWRGVGALTQVHMCMRRNTFCTSRSSQQLTFFNVLKPRPLYRTLNLSVSALGTQGTKHCGFCIVVVHAWWPRGVFKHPNYPLGTLLRKCYLMYKVLSLSKC